MCHSQLRWRRNTYTDAFTFAHTYADAFTFTYADSDSDGNSNSDINTNTYSDSESDHGGWNQLCHVLERGGNHPRQRHLPS